MVSIDKLKHEISRWNKIRLQGTFFESRSELITPRIDYNLIVWITSSFLLSERKFEYFFRVQWFVLFLLSQKNLFGKTFYFLIAQMIDFRLRWNSFHSSDYIFGLPFFRGKSIRRSINCFFWCEYCFLITCNDGIS